MVQLVLVVCLLGSPNACEEQRPMIHDLSLMGCMVLAQQHAAQWLDEHPNWMLSRWRCEQNIPRQRPA